METKLITLTTDFGHKDPFVGIMKGVIFAINPNARVIDLSHAVPPQDIMAGALVLKHSAPFFPRGTIHVAVVDPGVGSERKPLLVEAEGLFFIGPDNGVLSLALEGKKVKRVIELSNEAYHLKPKSATFHGRDLFAPVAAHLSLGIPPADFGVPAKDYARFSWPRVLLRGRSVEGEIIYVDSFGNLVTNIREPDLGALRPERLKISLGGITVHGLVINYSARKNGYAGLINSWGLLEISTFMGSAQLQSGAKVGDRVEVQENKKS
jgi:hypothetical protein